MNKMFARIKGMIVKVPKFNSALDYEVSEYFAKGHYDLQRLTEALGFKDQSSLYKALKDYRVKVQFLNLGVNHDSTFIKVYHRHLIDSLQSVKSQVKQLDNGNGKYVSKSALAKLAKRKG